MDGLAPHPRCCQRVTQIPSWHPPAPAVQAVPLAPADWAGSSTSPLGLRPGRRGAGVCVLPLSPFQSTRVGEEKV